MSKKTDDDMLLKKFCTSYMLKGLTCFHTNLKVYIRVSIWFDEEVETMVAVR